MPNEPKTYAVIVAAGRGSRAASDDGPKQYRMLGGKSVLQRTLDAFLNHPALDGVVVCIHPDDEATYVAAVTAHPKLRPFTHGGATRQASVMAGLAALENASPDHVLIHDAARPFVSAGVIDRVCACLKEAPAALPALAIADTLKRGGTNSEVVDTISRESLFAAQTPQGFHYATILAAHQKAANAQRSDFTDDSALAEWADVPVTLVDGDAANSKLTTNHDIAEAQNRMTNAIPDIRTGHGYDVHQLVPGDSIWLCGVEIPHHSKLDGHSDADVGLHALTDALLACIADGDIGSHFPPSDPKWKDARSDQFLAHAAKLVREAGGTMTHCDVTLVCETPKIGPHRDVMRKTIAAILNIDMSRVSVKATTNERIGFIGREEGIAALSTATIVMTST